MHQRSRDSGAILSAPAAIDKFLALVYKVAVDEADWREVVDGLSNLFDGEQTTLFLIDAQAGTCELLASTLGKLNTVPDRFLQVAFRNGRRSKAQLPTARLIGAGRSRATLLPADDLLNWNSPLDSQSGYVAGTLLRSSESTYFCVALGDDGPRGEVPLPPQELIDVVLPHLARAAEIAHRLDTASSQLNAVSQILDCVPVCVIRLDRNGAVTDLNTAALHIAQGRDGLTITTSGVHAVNEADEARLQKSIAEATAHRGSGYAKCLRIGRRHGTPYGVVVTSIKHQRLASHDRTSCVLYVNDPDMQRPVTPEAVASVLGLTPAQARIVSSLAMAVPLSEAAAKMGITVNTARTLLARAMARTGTSSQVGIVRLALTALIPLPSGE